MDQATADNPLVTVHAARRPNGDLGVLLINNDPDAAHDIALNYQGYTPSTAAPTVLSYGNGDSDLHSGIASTLTPYSITLLIFHPSTSNAAAPAAPGTPNASAGTDRSAKTSWPA